MTFVKAFWKMSCKFNTGTDFKVKVKVIQSCLTLCDPMDCTVHEILQARIPEWAAVPFSRGIFPTQGLNSGLPHCRWILYQLSHQGSPGRLYAYSNNLHQIGAQ